MNTLVYLGLGSNLGDSVELLQSAIKELDLHPQFTVTRQSSFYRSKPLDNMQQPDYYNMVLEAETNLSPEALLDLAQAVENNHGRVREGEQWQSRTLDIDILLFGQQIIKTERLMVPHIGMTERDFVLFPLNELSPNLMVPLLGYVRDLADRCDDRGLEIIGE